jgi:hypothetical protein
LFDRRSNISGGGKYGLHGMQKSTRSSVPLMRDRVKYDGLWFPCLNRLVSTVVAKRSSVRTSPARRSIRDAPEQSSRFVR